MNDRSKLVGEIKSVECATPIAWDYRNQLAYTTAVMADSEQFDDVKVLRDMKLGELSKRAGCVQVEWEGINFEECAEEVEAAIEKQLKSLRDWCSEVCPLVVRA